MSIRNGISYDTQADHLRYVLANVIGTHGLDTPSLRTLAREAGLSDPALRKWFGDKASLHARVFEVLATYLSKEIRWSVVPDRRGLRPFDHLIGDIRLRLAFAELARTDTRLLGILTELEAVERERIVEELDHHRRPDSRPGREWRSETTRTGSIVVRPPDDPGAGDPGAGDPGHGDLTLEGSIAPDSDEAHLLHHVLIGIWSHLSAVDDPISPQRARELWDLSCARVVPVETQLRTT